LEYRIVFYQAADGSKPVVAFLESLRERNTILHKLTTAGIRKLRYRENHGRPLTAQVTGTMDILELRVGDRDIARVFFFFRPNREIVCTNGYVKKSDKLDPREVDRAERYKHD
jgi:phage-related protein